MGPAADSEAAASVGCLCSLPKAALQSLLLGDWWVSTSHTQGKPLAFSEQGCFVSTNFIVESFEPREGPSGEMLLSYSLARLVVHWPPLPSPCQLPLPFSGDSSIMHSLESSTTARFCPPGIQLKANLCPIRKDNKTPRYHSCFVYRYLLREMSNLEAGLSLSVAEPG